MLSASRTGILKGLQADILRLEGFKSAQSTTLDIGLGSIKDAFPNRSFPTGAIHEFLSERPEDTASTCGFITGLLLPIMKDGAVLWISSSQTLFPPALKSFGVKPDHFIFINLQKEKDILWAMNEALKCSALSAVVSQVRDVDFTTSRRLQLAVEQSQVTGFVVRSPRKLNPTASVSRWKISSLPSASIAEDNFPGIGFPKWRVELLRMRNGKTGAWNLQWINGQFVHAEQFISHQEEQTKKAG